MIRYFTYCDSRYVKRENEVQSLRRILLSDGSSK